MLSLDLTGKRAFVAGVGDDRGYGWGIVRALIQAGALVRVGTWPPVLNIFHKSIARGKFDMSLPGGGEIEFEKVHPMDAAFDTPEDVPEEIREDKRYRDLTGYTIQEVADSLRDELGESCLDIVVHALANGPEVKKPLVDTSRAGYLAAVSASAYSMVSMVQRFGPLMREGGAVVSLTYLAGERVVPGYGGGMSSAKAALESDTRTLAFEAGRRWGIRVNTISAGPLASRAADVGHAAVFLCSPLGAAITGETLHVDMGYHAMGMPAQGQLEQE